MSDAKQITHVQLLPCNPDAPRTARGAAANMLAGLGCNGERADDLVLAVSELVANAVVHGSGPELELRLAGTAMMIRVEVGDQGTKAFVWHANGAPPHRGLSLVRLFSDRFGVVQRPTTLVWCEFDLA